MINSLLPSFPFLSLLLIGTLAAQSPNQAQTQTERSQTERSQKGRSLLDLDLTHFERWLGVPHASVTGLPEGTYQSENVHQGIPLGLERDLKGVFTVFEHRGVPILKITGEIYGGLTTKEEFENYYLSLKFKWGEKKWPPRETIKRDSGILYHCYGPHGRFWQTWKTSLEFQVQESDLGDFIPLGGNTAVPPVGSPLVAIRGRQITYDNGHTQRSYDPDSETYLPSGGYISASLEPDSPHGEWNHLELYVLGNTAVHLANGQIVMVVENARKADQSPLVKGHIQLQSEAAECYYKEIVISPLARFPAFIDKEVRWKQ